MSFFASSRLDSRNSVAGRFEDGKEIGRRQRDLGAGESIQNFCLLWYLGLVRLVCQGRKNYGEILICSHKLLTDREALFLKSDQP